MRFLRRRNGRNVAKKFGKKPCGRGNWVSELVGFGGMTMYMLLKSDVAAGGSSTADVTYLTSETDSSAYLASADVLPGAVVSPLGHLALVSKMGTNERDGCGHLMTGKEEEHLDSNGDKRLSREMEIVRRRRDRLTSFSSIDGLDQVRMKYWMRKAKEVMDQEV